MKTRIITSKYALIAIVFLGLGCAGCSRKELAFTELFSPIYKELTPDIWKTDGKVDIVNQQKTGSWNPKTRRGSNQLEGVLTGSGEEVSCAALLRLVDQFVQSRTGKYHVEGQGPSSLKGDERHIHTVWMHNWESRHGELHLWLFPYPDRKQIAFAIYHSEEELK